MGSIGLACLDVLVLDLLSYNQDAEGSVRDGALCLRNRIKEKLAGAEILCAPASAQGSGNYSCREFHRSPAA
jgi:hypothetical protein